MEYPPSMEDWEYAGQPEILYVLHFPVDMLTRCLRKFRQEAVCASGIKHRESTLVTKNRQVGNQNVKGVSDLAITCVWIPHLQTHASHIIAPTIVANEESQGDDRICLQQRSAAYKQMKRTYTIVRKRHGELLSLQQTGLHYNCPSKFRTKYSGVVHLTLCK